MNNSSYLHQKVALVFASRLVIWKQASCVFLCVLCVPIKMLGRDMIVILLSLIPLIYGTSPPKPPVPPGPPGRSECYFCLKRKIHGHQNPESERGQDKRPTLTLTGRHRKLCHHISWGKVALYVWVEVARLGCLTLCVACTVHVQWMALLLVGVTSKSLCRGQNTSLLQYMCTIWQGKNHALVPRVERAARTSKIHCCFLLAQRRFSPKKQLSWK